MKTKGTISFTAGLIALLLGTTCLAGAAAAKKEAVRVATLEQPTAAQVLYEKPAAVLGEKEKLQRKMIAMGRRVEEQAAAGVPVQTSLKTGISLPKTCMPGEACPLTLVVENKGNIPVVSPILSAVTLGTSGSVSATTKTTGWACGHADPKLTCASTGIALQPGEKSSFVVDWMPPEVKAKETTKICVNLVWPGRPVDGVYRADQIAAVQFALQRAGFETGGIDGRIRPKTLQAIRLLREVAGIPGPPQITPDLLNNLFGEVGKLSYDADTSDDQACANLDLIPAEKKPEVIAIVTPAPAPEVKAPESTVKIITPPVAPKSEEKKEEAKVIVTIQPEKKAETPKSVTAPAVTPPASKVEIKIATPAPAPAPKMETKVEIKPATPVAKVGDRLAPTAAAPKGNTIALPAAPSYPVGGSPSKAETDENELTIISTERGNDLFYRRSTLESGKPDYYVVDRGEGMSQQKVASLQTCDCKPVAAKSVTKAVAPRMRAARKASAKPVKSAAYIPTAREFLNGWPNIVDHPKF
jgi:peptidoglycan hydrolase-like protein with peptidoglycan-binding domain